MMLILTTQNIPPLDFFPGLLGAQPRSVLLPDTAQVLCRVLSVITATT